MMFWYGGHWSFWQVCLMWVGMIAFWALAIWAVYAIVTGARRTSEPPQSPIGNSRHILDERLARGEIDVEEYRRLRDAIDSGSDQSPVVSAT